MDRPCDSRCMACCHRACCFSAVKRTAKEQREKTNVDNRQTALVVEGILTVLLVAAGIVLRIREIQLMDLDVAAEDVWFDTVRVTTQTQIPQVVHGAVYLYLQILHGLLLLLGNKITVALGFQAGLQILGWILCYFAVRRLTGPAAAVTALGFGMLWPLCWKVVVLGPEELYQMLWMIGLCLVAAALNTFRRKGEQKGVRPILSFFIAGVAMGVLTYLDITGLLLYLPILSVLHWRQRKRKLWDFYIECGQHYWQLSEAQSDSLFQSQ